MSLLYKLSGNQMQFLNKPYPKQLNNGLLFARGGVYVPTKKHVVINIISFSVVVEYNNKTTPVVVLLD